MNLCSNKRGCYINRKGRFLVERHKKRNLLQFLVGSLSTIPLGTWFSIIAYPMKRRNLCTKDHLIITRHGRRINQVQTIN